MLVRKGYSKLTYAEKVAQRICVRCHATRLLEEIHARCDECLDEIARQNRVRYTKKGGRAKKRVYYRENRTAILEAQQDRVARKKATGECRDCPNKASRNSIRCRECEKKRSAAAAARWDEQRWKPMPTKENDGDESRDAGAGSISSQDAATTPSARVEVAG